MKIKKQQNQKSHKIFKLREPSMERNLEDVCIWLPTFNDSLKKTLVTMQLSHIENRNANLSFTYVQHHRCSRNMWVIFYFRQASVKRTGSEHKRVNETTKST
jgi:hypothetical protein